MGYPIEGPGVCKAVKVIPLGNVCFNDGGVEGDSYCAQNGFCFFNVTPIVRAFCTVKCKVPEGQLPGRVQGSCPQDFLCISEGQYKSAQFQFDSAMTIPIGADVALPKCNPSKHGTALSCYPTRWAQGRK
jgi:hypothetical protein